MMNTSQDFDAVVDASILLKSKKEHFEKETDKLLSYFGEEFKFQDPLCLIGQRFKDKEAEFATMRRENEELLIKTRNLTDEISKLKCSLGESGLKYEDQDMHLSLNRSERLENITASKNMTLTLASHNEQIRGSLGKIDRLLGETRENYTDYSK
jgi:hypothetical protein